MPTRKLGERVSAIAVTTAVMLGTIPAVGGYSNTHGRLKSGRPEHASAPVPGDFTTVGIVTQVEGNAFSVPQGSAAGEALAVGKGVLSGDRIWVEPASLVRLTDTEGNRLTLAGPASVEFVRSSRVAVAVRVVRGSLKFRALEGHSMRFDNAFVSGLIEGEGALWASDELIQVVGLAGTVKIWHPKLAAVVVAVRPGFFSEASPAFRFLQPGDPVRVEPAGFERFLTRFDEPELAARGLASSEPPSEVEAEPLESLRGSRTREEVVEARNEDVLARLHAHLVGEYVDEDRVSPRKVSAGPAKARHDVWGQPILSRKPAKSEAEPVEGGEKPGFDVLEQQKREN